MSQEMRGNMTVGMWFLSALVLVALFLSAGAQGELTSGHILIAFTILALLIIGTSFLWVRKDRGTSQEKNKRRIENLLRDMSDEDLFELQQRLSDVALRHETMTHALGDDGELVRRS